MSKKIIIIAVIIVVALGGYFLFKRSYQSPTPPLTSSQQSTSQSSAVRTPVAETAPLTGQNVIVYTDMGYSPGALRVKSGNTVTFKNESSRAMWTASAAHPTHRVYPTTGACISSTFDACRGIQSGDLWSFKFDIVGTWKYHNHLNPGDTGTIIVE